jgi:uncharacterized protein with von Willebrand factor type A (vWA) domain
VLVPFFNKLRAADLPVSLTELLTLLSALQHRVAAIDVDEFYYLSRATLVKDEKHFDRFDLVFSAYFKGLEDLFDEVAGEIPLEWLAKQAELMLTEEEKRQIESLGGWDELMQTLRERLEEQREAHHGGSKWIGTGGTSPFGANGYNPEGVRMGPDSAGNRRAVKVWDKREYRNLDDSLELGTRNIKLALRRLRKFAREGAEEELDLDDTIEATARNGGLLDIRMVAERRNAIKVLLLLDIGGSMNDHVKVCEELFSAAKTEFKHIESFYFHNFLYEAVWKDNHRRHSESTSMMELLHTYGRDYKVILVGDATMSPYEIMAAGGSVEHWNEEPGAVWMSRLLAAYPYTVWLNPQPEESWQYIPSIKMTNELLEERMFPLTIAGLDKAMRELKHSH